MMMMMMMMITDGRTDWATVSLCGTISSSSSSSSASSGSHVIGPAAAAPADFFTALPRSGLNGAVRLTGVPRLSYLQHTHTHRAQSRLLPPPRRLCFHSCLSVCLSVNRIAQERLIKSLWNFTEWLDIIQGPMN